MADRWDASVNLRHSLEELAHCIDHVAFRDHPHYAERGRTFSQEARSRAREYIPLLGTSVETAVLRFTDNSILLFDSAEAEAGSNLRDLVASLDLLRLEGKAHQAIDEALKSLPRLP
jgi:hypothetical protein